MGLGVRMPLILWLMTKVVIVKILELCLTIQAYSMLSLDARRDGGLVYHLFLGLYLSLVYLPPCLVSLGPQLCLSLHLRDLRQFLPSPWLYLLLLWALALLPLLLVLCSFRRQSQFRLALLPLLVLPLSVGLDLGLDLDPGLDLDLDLPLLLALDLVLVLGLVHLHRLGLLPHHPRCPFLQLLLSLLTHFSLCG